MSTDATVAPPRESAEHMTPAHAVHPLYRLAKEAPEQLEPTLRRAALRMVRRRFGRWLRETLSAAISMLEHARRRAVHQA